MQYKLVSNHRNEIVCIVSSDGKSIPFDPANSDYQAYLAWVAEGNEPLPAETE